MRYIQPFGITDEDASYVNGNPAIGLGGSIPPAECIEPRLREIVHSIIYSGFTEDTNDLTQFSQAVRSQRLNYCVDVGTVNNLAVVCTPIVQELTPGLALRVKVKFTNTGAALIMVNGIGPTPVRRGNNANLAAGDILTGEVVDLVYDGAVFQVANFLGYSADVKNNNFYNFNIPYAEDTGSVNALHGVFDPAITSLGAGDLIEIKVANNNTGNVTVQVNDLPAKSLKTPTPTGMQQLSADQIVDGQIALMVFDGLDFQIISTAVPKSGTVPTDHIRIAKRQMFQDQNLHAVTQLDQWTEAFRVSYAPVSVGNAVRINLTGSMKATHPDDDFSVWIYLAYSIDNGSTWNPPSWPGLTYFLNFPGWGQMGYGGPPILIDGTIAGVEHQEPHQGTFAATAAMVRVQTFPGLKECNFQFALAGEMIVPSGPPSEILFRVVFAASRMGIPYLQQGVDYQVYQALHGGAIIDVIEYTPKD